MTDIFHDLKQYRIGRAEDGDDLFSVPLKPDKDGLIGRECPNSACEPKYFKISLEIPDDMADKLEDFSQYTLTCPYCATVNNTQNYHTQAQIEWIKSMMFRDVARAFDNILGEAFRPLAQPTRGLISFNITYKPGPLPSVRHHVEEQLKRVVTCDSCRCTYAVYGMSMHCPFCGEGNILQHLDRSAGIIKSLIEEYSRISEERGLDVGNHLLGNALEDVVSLFEGFLKYIYTFEVKQRHAVDEAEVKVKRIRVNFQRLKGAEDFFRQELEIELFARFDNAERVFLQEQFLKRHVLSHNLGLVDEQYLAKAQAFARQGSELEILSSDVLQALAMVESIIVDASNFITKTTY